MKWWLAGLLVVGVAIVLLGPPGADPSVRRAPRFGGERPILPMTFAHGDHAALPCAGCHHEFVDGTTGSSCLSCHVTDPEVAPLLEAQFHALCRTCHVEARAAGEAAGPTRRCVGCHVEDGRF